MFGKKKVVVTEQVMEEVTDEQLSQVTGGVIGGLLNTPIVGGLTDTVDGTVCLVKQLDINVSNIGVEAVGVKACTPWISPKTLLP